MKPSIYIESSIFSYLRSRPSGHVVSAARQLLTLRWWAEERAKYELVTSQYVIDEISKGTPTLANERLESAADIQLARLDDSAVVLADKLISLYILPEKARLDALHICLATVYEIQYLLTWNCTHIANARILPRIDAFMSKNGLRLPFVCTPEELLDDEYPIH